MTNPFLALGAVFGFLGVGAGAFGAHALKARLSPDLLQTFEIGVKYQMYHALALLVVGVLWARQPAALLSASGWLFCAGVGIFSGSLYALALSGQRWLGAVTPLGGLCFLAGWVSLLLFAGRGE